MGKLIKDSANPQFAKGKDKPTYASLAAVLETVRGPLTDAGIVLYQSASASDGGVMVRSMLIHAESGESIEEVLPLPVAQQTAQAYGSAITYGRRYLAMAMCGLAPDDDDGNEGSQQKQVVKPVVQASHRQGRAPADASPHVDVRVIVEDGKGNVDPVDDITVEGSEPLALDDEPPFKVRDWLATKNPIGAAKAWAVTCHAQPNSIAAENSWLKVVKAAGGYAEDKKAAILTAYYFRQQEHLNEVSGVAVA